MLYILAAASFYALISNDLRIFKEFIDLTAEIKSNSPQVASILVCKDIDPQKPKYLFRMEKGHTTTKLELEERCKSHIEQIHKHMIHPFISSAIYIGITSSLIGYASFIVTLKGKGGVPLRALTTGFALSMLSYFAYSHLRIIPPKNITLEDYTKRLSANIEILEYQDYNDNRIMYNQMKDLMEAVQTGRERERKRSL